MQKKCLYRFHGVKGQHIDQPSNHPYTPRQHEVKGLLGKMKLLADAEGSPPIDLEKPSQSINQLYIRREINLILMPVL